MKVIEKDLKGAGVCASKVRVEYDGNVIESITFVGGCNGFAKAVQMLAMNHSISVVAERLKGITCGRRKTSCPNELAKILEGIC